MKANRTGNYGNQQDGKLWKPTGWESMEANKTGNYESQ